MPQFTPPPPNCPRCPRLQGFLADNRLKYPTFHNAPVPSFGSLDAALLVVGLAPGLKGANQTGRPFTGDYAGDVLYPALLKHGFATGEYKARPDDGLELQNCRITNAVRCVPPENKPTTEEIRTCRPFLEDELQAMPNLKVILSLGTISHKAVSVACGYKQSALPFGHAAEHTLSPDRRSAPLTLLDSYHTSRYNIQTRRLTAEMFDGIMQRARALIANSQSKAA